MLSQVVLQKHDGGRRLPGAGLVEVEVGRNVAADVTMVLMRENPRNCSYHCTDWPWRHGGRGGGRDIN